MKQFSLRDTLIYLDHHSFHSFDKWLHSNNFDSIFIIADENTSVKCLPILLKHVPFLNNSCVIQMESGESSKSIEQVQTICSYLINKHITRHSLIVN